MADTTPQPPGTAVEVEHVQGDLLDQVGLVDALVNPWNRNFVPRWLLLPRGVSGALKRQTGPEPWRELRRRGLLELGEAVVTTGGRLPVSLIHVAGLTLTWRATPTSVRTSVFSALTAAAEHRWHRIAMPLIGAGSGGLPRPQASEVIESAIVDWASRGPGATNTRATRRQQMTVRLTTLPPRGATGPD